MISRKNLLFFIALIQLIIIVPVSAASTSVSEPWRKKINVTIPQRVRIALAALAAGGGAYLAWRWYQGTSMPIGSAMVPDTIDQPAAPRAQHVSVVGPQTISGVPETPRPVFNPQEQAPAVAATSSAVAPSSAVSVQRGEEEEKKEGGSVVVGRASAAAPEMAQAQEKEEDFVLVFQQEFTQEQFVALLKEAESSMIKAHKQWGELLRWDKIIRNKIQPTWGEWIYLKTYGSPLNKLEQYFINAVATAKDYVNKILPFCGSIGKRFDSYADREKEYRDSANKAYIRIDGFYELLGLSKENRKQIPFSKIARLIAERGTRYQTNTPEYKQTRQLAFVLGDQFARENYDAFLDGPEAFKALAESSQELINFCGKLPEWRLELADFESNIKKS